MTPEQVIKLEHSWACTCALCTDPHPLLSDKLEPDDYIPPPIISRDAIRGEAKLENEE